MSQVQSFLASNAALFNFVVRDGNGVKGMVDSGLLDVPQRYVQPEQERIRKLDVPSYDSPPVDLSKLNGPNHDEVVNEIARAAETFGFFQVVNHGVPVALLESIKDAAHNFFGQPPEKKAIYRKDVSPTSLVKYGTSFAPEKEEVLEWKDSLSMVYTNDDEALQVWPEKCRNAALEYIRTSSKMVSELLKALIEKLGVEIDDAKMDGLMGSKTVNMNYYPMCPNPELTIGADHSDMGTLTVLLQDDIGGLYVKIEENIDGKKKGEWMEIPPLHGALVVNIGNVLEIVSNGKYKSGEHRVRTTSARSRVSIPIFIIPKGLEKIGPLAGVVENDGVAQYKEVVFQDYVDNFFSNAYNGKKSLDFARAYYLFFKIFKVFLSCWVFYYMYFVVMCVSLHLPLY